jgi:signal transduction histidine kinase
VPGAAPSLEERLRRAEVRAKAFQDVGLALGSTLDLDQLLELILRKTQELLEADRATLYLLDEQRGRLLSRIVIGDQTQSIELPVGEGIAGVVAKLGQPIRVRDAYRDKRFNKNWDELTGYRTRSILAAPMKNHVGRTIGVIQVLNKRSPTEVEFTAHDEELMGALATQAAISIDNSRLFLSVIQKNMQLVETKEQLEQRVADLKLLFELESAMGQAATLSDLARAVIVEAARACEAEGGGLLVDEGEEGVWLYHVDTNDKGRATSSSGQAELEVRRVAVKRGEGLIGLAMRTNQSQYWVQGGTGPAGSVEGKHVLSPRISKLFGLTITSSMAMPLEGPEDAAIGAIGLYNAARSTGFSQDARALLRLISANVSTAVLLFRSRTDREKAQRLSTIGRFLSGVMHDLKTPMTIISGYVQLMADTPDARARREHAELLLKQLEVIGTMQRELLDFARGKRTLWIRKIYLVPFSQELERDVTREIEGTKIKLEVVADDRGTARFDEHKLLRAIHNLVRNAIDAMADKGGRLTIRLAKDDGDLLVSVGDTGRGIPAEIKHRLFGTFVTAGKAGGTGLGLSIVKKIVEEHEGRIDVSSSASGTTFTLRLPQREAPGQATVEHGAPTPRASRAEPVPVKRPSERPTAKRKAPRSAGLRSAKGDGKGDAKTT